MDPDNKKIIDLDGKADLCRRLLAGFKTVAVAFSGGVDSSLLLALAVEALGRENVLAITALSATTAEQERRDAVAFAQSQKVRHLTVKSAELDDPAFTRNQPDKCYVCKKGRYQTLIDLAREKGLAMVVDGENADDKADFRPGSRAARELGVRSPLREAGLTKADIRKLSQQMGLASWNKPALACLASRIPYYQEITAEKLHQVDGAEQFLKAVGFAAQLRVRHHGDTARIELDEADFPLILDEKLRRRVVRFMRSLGFQFVTLDLEGYAMGSLNRTIASETDEEPERT